MTLPSHVRFKPELLDAQHEFFASYSHFQGHVFKIIDRLSDDEWLAEMVGSLSRGGEPQRLALHKDDVEPAPAPALPRS